MAIGGKAANGYWMQIQDGRISMDDRQTMTTVTVSEYTRAIERLITGERVHVGVYANMHIDVMRTLKTILKQAD